MIGLAVLIAVLVVAALLCRTRGPRDGPADLPHRRAADHRASGVLPPWN